MTDEYITGLEARIPEENTPVHVINIDIQDNHEEATIGAFMICELAALVSVRRPSCGEWGDGSSSVCPQLHTFALISWNFQTLCVTWIVGMCCSWTRIGCNLD